MNKQNEGKRIYETRATNVRDQDKYREKVKHWDKGKDQEEGKKQTRWSYVSQVFFKQDRIKIYLSTIPLKYFIPCNNFTWFCIWHW